MESSLATMLKGVEDAQSSLSHVCHSAPSPFATSLFCMGVVCEGVRDVRVDCTKQSFTKPEKKPQYRHPQESSRLSTAVEGPCRADDELFYQPL